jgi:hypothetical protein
LLLARQAESQVAGGPSTQASPPKIADAVFNYLNMAGTLTAADFKPLNQEQRNHLYTKSLINPVMYFKAGISGAIDHANDKPFEWGQGGGGYGKRVANITGQYAIQRTVTFGVASLLHEDNRYFGSGKKGFWPRTGYAVSSSVLARHDDGTRYLSVSLIGGFAAAAFISRSWQPPSTHSVTEGAKSFGFSMNYNVIACIVKEFLPDLVRPLTKRRQPPDPTPANTDRPSD